MSASWKRLCSFLGLLVSHFCIFFFLDFFYLCCPIIVSNMFFQILFLFLLFFFLQGIVSTFPSINMLSSCTDLGTQTCSIDLTQCFNPHLRICLLILEREGERERRGERERDESKIISYFLYTPQPGIEPATQVCVLC